MGPFIVSLFDCNDMLLSLVYPELGFEKNCSLVFWILDVLFTFCVAFESMYVYLAINVTLDSDMKYLYAMFFSSLS